MAPMMRLVLGLGVLVFILSAVALGLPAHVTATRSVVINAPEHFVFPYVNAPRRYAEWAPWAIQDPNLKVTYSGPPEGSGAKAEWESDVPAVGNGSIQILESEAPSRVSMAADYKGLQGISDFDLAPSGAGSKVSWSFGFETGSSPLKRWKGLVLDRFVGEEYEKGLQKLKEVVESARAPTIRQPAPAPVPMAVPAPEDAEATGGETVVPESAPAEETPAQ